MGIVQVEREREKEKERELRNKRDKMGSGSRIEAAPKMGCGAKQNASFYFILFWPIKMRHSLLIPAQAHSPIPHRIPPPPPPHPPAYTTPSASSVTTTTTTKV
jgi:hypothetical protein